MQNTAATEGSIGSERDLLAQAFSRGADARLVLGNRLRLLRDAAENYPAWLGAIETARRTIHFGSYIIRADQAGALFAEALVYDLAWYRRQNTTALLDF